MLSVLHQMVAARERVGGSLLALEPSAEEIAGVFLLDRVLQLEVGVELLWLVWEAGLVG